LARSDFVAGASSAAVSSRHSSALKVKDVRSFSVSSACRLAASVLSRSGVWDVGWPPRMQMLDFPQTLCQISLMTELLQRAFDTARKLDPAEQDSIACAIMALAGELSDAPVPLTPAERNAIARSQAAAASGEFATDEQVRAVWAKHGL
jgi:hypothetical protein